MTIYSWHPVLTPHQAHTLHALGEVLGTPVRVVTASREQAIRKAQGWAANDDTLIVPEILPERGWIQRIKAILDGDPTAIHLFGSPFERSRINWALLGAALQRRTLFLISEPYSTHSVGYLDDSRPGSAVLKAKLRPFVYAAYGRLLRGRVAGVFAISPLAISQYQVMGISRIFPFGYFVPGVRPTAKAGGGCKRLKVAYLGSFIERKGISGLIAAFRSDEVVASGALLTLFGPNGESVGAMASSNICYGGALSFGQVQHTLAKFDLLVVPSIFDGWAVVVNEAIQAGVPVLSSNAVGAGAMISRWDCGARFPAGDIPALAREIAAIANDREKLASWRKGAQTLACELEPRVAGAYMAECIQTTLDGRHAPEAPWY